jgi:CheY-like chemotaxis protein
MKHHKNTRSASLKTILVIEDEQPLINAIKEKLGQNNFRVISVKTVEEGLKLVRDLPKIDLVWLDHYLLGHKTGIDFVGQVKTNPLTKNIPVFIVSVSTDPTTSYQYLHLGAEEYYTKSAFKLQDIIDDIKKHI